MEKGISRREALKRMGFLVAGATVATTGLSTLASCGSRKKKRIILYFTATGNCLHIARELADPEDTLLSIPQLVKEGRYELEADEIGIVYPIYGHMPPNMVREYMKKAKLKAGYRFAVLTYGNRKCNAVEIWDGFTRGIGMPFHYISTLIMVDNWLPNFDMNEQMKIDKHIPENVERIRGDLAQDRHWVEPVSDLEREQHAGFMQATGLDPEKGFLLRSENQFRVTEDCVGCGICTSVCPRGNYGMTSSGVKTEGDCDYCFACIQNCPQKAILFARKEGEFFGQGEVNPKARYRNEHVSLASIKLANNQW